jgi:hypothetical protein
MTQSAQSEPALNAAIAPEFSKDAFRAIWTAPSALVHVNVIAGFEIVEFANRVLAAQIDLLNNLTRCQSLGDAARLHADFVRSEAVDCAREVSNLADLARDNVAAVADAIDEPRGSPPR